MTLYIQRAGPFTTEPLQTFSTIVSVEVNISVYFYSTDIRIYLLLDNELNRKIDVTAMQFLLDQNRHQTHDWTLIGSGANGLGILECWFKSYHCESNILLFKLRLQSLSETWKYSHECNNWITTLCRVNYYVDYTNAVE